MQIRIGAASARGAGYGHNDDRLMIVPELDVCAVADSTGSRGRASDVLLNGIRAHLRERGKARSIAEIEAAVRTGETALVEAMKADRRVYGGGTTLDIVTFDEDRMLGIHVGDGRIYHLRDGVATQLSTDHTWIQEQVAAGLIDPAEARNHPLQNVITRAFIGGEPVQFETLTVPLAIGDTIVLCTDGVWKSLPEESFLHASPDAIESVLYRSSEGRRWTPRSKDNATMAVVQVVA